MNECTAQFFKELTAQNLLHGMTARIFRTESSAQDLLHIFDFFFLTFFKDFLPIVSINTLLVNFRQLLLMQKKCAENPCGCVNVWKIHVW